MNTNLSLAASDSRKRKMKETLEYPARSAAAPPPLLPRFSSTAPGASGSRQLVSNYDDTILRLGTGGVARPLPAVVHGGGNVGLGGGSSMLNVPFESYTSLLMNGDDDHHLKTTIEIQKNFLVDQISKCYDACVRGVLDELFKKQYTMMTVADERASKRAPEQAEEQRHMKERLAKMEKEMAYHNRNAAAMVEKVKALEERLEKAEAALKVVPSTSAPPPQRPPKVTVLLDEDDDEDFDDEVEEEENGTVLPVIRTRRPH